MSHDVIPEWNGFPPDPDVNGWHWGIFPGAETPVPVYWESGLPGPYEPLWRPIGSGILLPDQASSRFAYVAPCLLPVEVIALMRDAAERMRSSCARRVDDPITLQPGMAPDREIDLRMFLGGEIRKIEIPISLDGDPSTEIRVPAPERSDTVPIEVPGELAHAVRAMISGEAVAVAKDPTPEGVAAWWRTKNGGYPWEPLEDTSDYAAYRALITVAGSRFG